MKNLFNASYPMKCRSWGLLVLRTVAGIIFVLHGYGKLTGNPSLELFSGMVAGIGFPAPMFFAWVVALTELLGGIALLLGIFVKPATFLLGIVMIIAFTAIKKFQLPMGDPDLALLGVVIALYSMGPGRFSIEAHMCKKDDKTCAGGCCQSETERA